MIFSKASGRHLLSFSAMTLERLLASRVNSRKSLAAAQNRTGEESLTRRVGEPGSEQGGHPVGAANALTLHPGVGLFHPVSSFAAANLFPQAAACGGGVKVQAGRLESASRILEQLTRPARILPHHGNPRTDQLRQRLRPGDALTPEQACIPFGGAQ